MDFKKLFENNKAVSPVIGVILMVAITVILAAAIGSSVFSHGTAESAPQANFDIKAVSAVSGSTPATIRIEHLGGDPVHFEDPLVTKVMASVDDGESFVMSKADNETSNGGLGTMDVGSVKQLQLTNGTALPVAAGHTVNLKFVDVKTNQLICDKDVRF